MKIGVLLTPGPQAIRQVQRAEELGFEAAFLTDNPMVYGDPFASFGACLAATQRIRIGTFCNPQTRHAPLIAAMLASLNAIGPGRVMLAVGTGSAGAKALGLPSATLRQLESFIIEVKGLLAGQLVQTSSFGPAKAVKLIDPRLPWMDVEEPISLYVTASAPRALAMAGRLADGIVIGGVSHPSLVKACRRFAQLGVEAAGRDVDAIPIAVTPSAYLSSHSLQFEEMVEVLGPKSLGPASTFATLVERSPEVPEEVKAAFLAARYPFRATKNGADDLPPHIRAYEGYLQKVHPWQRALMSETLLRVTSIAGTPDECLEQLQALRAAGVSLVILSPLPHLADESIEMFGREVLPHLTGERG